MYQVMSINLDDRIRNEVIRTPSIRHFGGQLWAGQVGLLDILQSKDNWNFFNIHFVVRILNQDYMPNFSQIGEMKWPRLVEKA